MQGSLVEQRKAGRVNPEDQQGCGGVKSMACSRSGNYFKMILNVNSFPPLFLLFHQIAVHSSFHPVFPVVSLVYWNFLFHSVSLHCFHNISTSYYLQRRFQLFSQESHTIPHHGVLLPAHPDPERDETSRRFLFHRSSPSSPSHSLGWDLGTFCFPSPSNF